MSEAEYTRGHTDGLAEGINAGLANGRAVREQLETALATALAERDEARRQAATAPRVLPDEETVARTWHEAANGSGSWDRATDHVRARQRARAEAVLALLAEQPTVAEVETEEKARRYSEGFNAAIAAAPPGVFFNAWNDEKNPYRKDT